MSDITAKVKLDYSGFVGAMQRVDAALVGAQRRAVALQAGFGGIVSVFGQIAAVGAGLKSALDLGGKMSDLAAASGATAGEMLVFRQAVVNAGLGAESAGVVVARLQKAIGGINEDGQSTSDVFTKLGINLQSLSGMDLTQQMQTLSSAFARIDDPAQRAALAIEIFGRSGAQLLPLFRDSTAFSTASQQVGGLADTMDAASSKFDTLSDALGAMGVKSDQFFSAMANAMTDGAGMADTLNSIDLTGWGEAVGASLKSVGDAAGLLAPALGVLAPVMAGIAGTQAAVALTGLKLGGVMGGTVANALRITQAELAKMAVTAAAGGFSLASVGRLGTVAFAGLAGAARSAGRAIMAAFGPVGIVLMAATAIMQKVLGDLAEAKAMEASVRQNARSNVRNVERNATSIEGISNAEEQAAVVDDINGQLESQRDMLADLEEGETERRRQIEGQIRILEIQRSQAERITAETMAANAAEKERAKSIAEAAENEAKLAEEKDKAAKREAESRVKLREGAVADLGKWREQQEMDAAETPEEKRAILMRRSGMGSAEAIDARIAELGKLVALGNASTTEAEVAELGKLTGIRGQVSVIDREAARKVTADQQAVVDDKAARAAELLDATRLPRVQTWADSARSMGLGGSAASNQSEIAKLQAERQREANGLLKEIRELLKANSKLSSPTGDLVFN